MIKFSLETKGIRDRLTNNHISSMEEDSDDDYGSEIVCVGDAVFDDLSVVSNMSMINSENNVEFELTKNDKLDLKNWNFNCEKLQLSEEFMVTHKDMLIWESICKFQRLSEIFMEKFSEKLHWENVSRYQVLSSKFIDKYCDKLNWENLCKYQHLSQNIMEKYKTKLVLPYVYTKQNINEELLEYFWFQLDRKWVCKNKKLSEKFLEKNNNSLHWSNVCKFQKLSIEFMTKHYNKLDWKNVCKYQNLTEEFALKFCNKICWNYYSYLYNVSPKLQQFVCKDGNWLYKTRKEKRTKAIQYYKLIMKGSIEYVECYKAVNVNYSSIFNSSLIVYNKAKMFYETICDYNEYRENSRGFGCWTKKGAIKYGYKLKGNNFRLLLCLVPLDSICMLRNGKIRTSKLFVVSEIDKRDF